MIRAICSVLFITLVGGQDGLSPLDFDVTDHIVQEWCSSASDCVAGGVVDPEVTCGNGICSCGGSYELYENSICRLIDGPPPTVTVIVELTWDDLKCGDLPDNFQVTVTKELQQIYGTVEVDIRLKCGSVIILGVMSNVDAQKAATTNIAQAMKSTDTESIAGPPSKMDTYSGSGSCIISEGQKDVISIAGVCQPISCDVGFVLQTFEDANIANNCNPISNTSTSPSKGEIAALSIGSGVLILIIVIIVRYYCRKMKSISPEEEEQGNGPENGSSDDDSSIFNAI
eukprot:TRINITY_DN28221_c0_g1_i1.p1 TRINITY_DN28221_c0_g1~~TRINITY_DN28221_c0_g1_i1.p1  ORF type:complete len:285 (+),score=56.19 TRINITY_DN28221_c0_g1_i1:42-896(+)